MKDNIRDITQALVAENQVAQLQSLEAPVRIGAEGQRCTIQCDTVL